MKAKASAVLQILALGLACGLPSTSAVPVASPLPEYEGLIRVQNGRFVDDNCQEFPVTGTNTWMLMETAAGLVYQVSEPDGMDPVQFTFSTAAANSLTVVRAFGHGVNGTLPLQTSPGVYNETAFRALDLILDTAAYNGVKIIFTMGDNWQSADSKMNYNMWAGFNESSDQFWTSNVTREMYKDHMKVMVNRVNTLNGVRYEDDPTIFAWNLMNEPRCNCFPTALPYPAIFSQLPPGCDPSCANMITEWVGEMSAYLKSVDSNHLVTVGEEGFWGYYDASMVYNPENSVSPWAALTGDNFTAQHNFKDIDFASIHYWPDEWTPGIASDWTFFGPWMEQHMNLTLAMGKPLVLEELGKDVVVNETVNVLETSITTTRLPFMQMVYSQYNQSLQTGGNWRGTLFWKWGYSPNNTADDELQIASQDVDFTSVIAPTALSALFQAASDSPLPGCIKVEAANVTEAAAPPGILTAAPIQAASPTLPATTVATASDNPDLSSITAVQTAGR